MKGLLTKDFYILINACRWFIIVIAFFTVLSFLPNDRTYVFFSTYTIIYTSMITLTLIDFDEKSKWNIYCDSLPVSRKTAVTEKYVITFIMIIGTWLLSSAARLLNLCINDTLIWSEFLPNIAQFLIIGIIYPSIMLPAIFKFGAQKGRLINFITIIAAFALGYAFYAVTESIKIVLIIGAFIVVAAVPVSWFLSVKFYEKREF